jgi:hypothetical protein
MLGRLAFPLFAWLIANGAYHTKDINKYLKRLFVFALISQVPFFYVNKLVFPDFDKLNIMFTLFIGLYAIKLIKDNKDKLSCTLIILASAVVGHVLKVDFGSIGVLSIIFFYIYFKDKKKLIISQTLIYLMQPIYRMLEFPQAEKSNFLLFYIYYTPFVLSTLILIFKYSGKPGRKMKYFFYLFYPLHFIVFYILRTL